MPMSPGEIPRSIVVSTRLQNNDKLGLQILWIRLPFIPCCFGFYPTVGTYLAAGSFAPASQNVLV